MIRISKATYVKDYLVDVQFTNGEHRMVDMYDFVSSSQHPVIRKYLDKALFAKVKVNHGALSWCNCFDIDPFDIYNWEFEAECSPYKA